MPHFVLDPGDLEAVHDEIDGVAVLSGVVPLDFQEGDAVTEVCREDLADLLGLRGDDHHGFCLVKTFHDEVHSPDRHKVGDDGIQRKDPAAEGGSDGDVEDHVVDHDKVADGQSDFLRKDGSQDFHAVDGAAQPERKPASNAGDQTAEDRAEQQVRSRKGRTAVYVDREHVVDEP